MLSRLFWAVVWVALALQTARAQDPTKVEPKHYQLRFENEWVQVVNVHYGPHEKSGLHDHPGGVVVVLTEGHLRFTDQDGKTKEVYAKAGESRWYPAFKHKVENLGDTAYNAVYIGVKAKSVMGKSDAKDDRVTRDAEMEKIVTEYLLASAQRH